MEYLFCRVQLQIKSHNVNKIGKCNGWWIQFWNRSINFDNIIMGQPKLISYLSPNIFSYFPSLKLCLIYAYIFKNFSLYMLIKVMIKETQECTDVSWIRRLLSGKKFLRRNFCKFIVAILQQNWILRIFHVRNQSQN